MKLQTLLKITAISLPIFSSLYAIEDEKINQTLQIFDLNKNGSLNESELSNAHEILAHIAYNGIVLKPVSTKKKDYKVPSVAVKTPSKAVIKSLNDKKPGRSCGSSSKSKSNSKYVESGDIGNIPMVGSIEDWESKLKAAKSKGQPIMLIASGESWCGWSKKLADNIYKTKEFQDFAKNNNVYWVPKNRSNPAKITELNSKLNVRGVPHVIVVNAKGELRNLKGYKDIGPKGYIEEYSK